MSVRRLAGALALASAAVLSAASAAAAPLYAASVVDRSVGAGQRGPEGLDETAALGAPDRSFYSLGVGGWLVLDFGAEIAGPVSIFDVTYVCVLSGDMCANWPERLEVYAGSDWVPGTGLDGNSGFTLVGDVGNGDAADGAELVLSGVHTQLLLLDASPRFDITGRATSGFDVSGVVATGVAPVPLPTTLPLLGAGLGLVWLRGRRRSA